MHNYANELLTEEELVLEDTFRLSERAEAKLDLEDLLFEISGSDNGLQALYYSLTLQLQIDYRARYLAGESRSEIIAFLKRKYDSELQDKTMQILRLQFKAMGYDPNPWINPTG